MSQLLETMKIISSLNKLMKNLNQNQRLYWSLSKPLKYMGLSLDEWGITLVGVVPGIILLNSGNAKLGLVCMIVSIALCYAFKKFKRVSEYFLLKSFLVAKKWLPAPACYPLLLGKIVGK